MRFGNAKAAATGGRSADGSRGDGPARERAGARATAVRRVRDARGAARGDPGARAEVIAGLNLPMLIKLASVRGRETLEACVAHAQDAGRKYISVASWVLAGEK